MSKSLKDIDNEMDEIRKKSQEKIKRLKQQRLKALAENADKIQKENEDLKKKLQQQHGNNNSSSVQEINKLTKRLRSIINFRDVDLVNCTNDEFYEAKSHVQEMINFWNRNHQN